MHMSVRHGSRTQPSARGQKPPQRHRLDHRFCLPDLGAVETTAAASDYALVLEGDATASAKKKLFKPSVCATAAD